MPFPSGADNHFQQVQAGTPAGPLPNQDREPRELLNLLAREQAVEVYDRIDPISLSDARQVASLFTQLYRDYPDPVLQNPEIICEKSRAGDWIAFVKRDSQGTIIGHGALLANEEGSYDLGRLVVSKTAQGSGLARELTRARIEYATTGAGVGEIDVIHTEMVTSHTATQKICSECGFVPTGLHLHKFTHFFDQGSNRESVLMKTKLIAEAPRSLREVYIPKPFEALAYQIYDSLAVERRFLVDQSSANISSDNIVPRINNTDLAGFGLSVIEAAAGQPGFELIQLGSEQIERGARFVEVKLDLSSPSTPAQSLCLKAAGYLFAGLEIGRFTDKLVLQFALDLNERSFDSLAIHAEQAQELCRLMRESFWR